MSASLVITCAGFGMCDSRPNHALTASRSATMERPSRRTGIPSLAQRCAVATGIPRKPAIAVQPLSGPSAAGCFLPEDFFLEGFGLTGYFYSTGVRWKSDIYGWVKITFLICHPDRPRTSFASEGSGRISRICASPCRVREFFPCPCLLRRADPPRGSPGGLPYRAASARSKIETPGEAPGVGSFCPSPEESLKSVTLTVVTGTPK